ncbi:MAG: TatD family hydrolase, partial [bacterium]|nr:TatD family hydrolase [bacterium]
RSIQLFDAHLHLRDDRLWPYHEYFLEAMCVAGVGGGIECACQPCEWRRQPRLPKGLSMVTAYGIHPWYVEQATPEVLQQLETLLQTSSSACVGEIGLDGIRSVDAAKQALQRTVFLKQVQLAIYYQRPIILHGARAWQALLDTLLPFAQKLPAVLFHGVMFAPELLQHPFFKACKSCYFSINLQLLNPRSKTLFRLLSHLPVERLLIETDAPDFLPRDAEPLLPGTTLNHPKHLQTLKERLETLLKTKTLTLYPDFLASLKAHK